MILGVQLGVGVQRARYNLTTVIVVSVVLQILYELALELLQLWIASKGSFRIFNLCMTERLGLLN